MSTTTAYRIAGSHVVHDSIDGETIVINLETGDYFSLDKGASWIWRRLTAGFGTDRLCDSLSFPSPEEKAHWEKGVASFVAQLLELGLVAPDDGLSSVAQPDSAPEESLTEFAPPTLQRYTDMQELLALDPIHEVDDAGWPKGDKN